MRLAGSLFLALAVAGSLARAESPPAPVCVRRPALKPPAGAHIPANLPAFLFQMPSYPLQEQHPIAWHAIELREAGGALVPHRVETFKEGFESFATISPLRPISPGALTVSFLDDCPESYVDRRPVEPPARNDRFVYQVTEASPLPTRLGTAVVRGVDYSRPRTCRDDTAAWVEIEVIPTPEVVAFREALLWRGATGDGLELFGPAELLPSYFDQQRGTFLFQQRAGCGPPRGNWRLGGGHSEMVYTVELYKGPVIEPVRVPVDVDCTKVPQVNPCAVDAAADDALPVADGAAPPGDGSGGCACGVGISPRTPGGLTLVVVLLLGLRGRRWRA